MLIKTEIKKDDDNFLGSDLFKLTVTRSNIPNSVHNFYMRKAELIKLKKQIEEVLE